jgi:hypothetical protein
LLQYVEVENSTINYNTKSGVRLANYAENGAYVAGAPCSAGCAEMAIYALMSGDTINGNHGAGISIENYANNFGAIRNLYSGYPTMVLAGVTADSNATSGLVAETIAKGHSYAYTYISASGSNFDHNTTFGLIEVTSAYSGSTVVDKNMLYAVKADYNGQSGIWTGDYALGGSSGITAANTLSGVVADHNGGYGLSLSASATGSVSHAYQSNTVRNGEFYDNGISGLALYAAGVGQAQHSKIYASNFNGNAKYALYGRAGFGGYQSIGYQTYGNMLNAGSTKFVSVAGATQVVR